MKKQYDASNEFKPFKGRGIGGVLTEDGPKRHPNKGRKAPAKADATVTPS